MRTLVVGDVHGCLEELDELLAAVAYRKGSDRLILAGDLVDRGPDPLGVLRRARELGAEAVLGNHEERHLRWRRHLCRQRPEPEVKNLMRPFSPRRQKEHDSLAEEDWAWLEALPLWLRIGPRWVVIHAGLEPDLPFAEQRPDTLLRMRWVRRSDRRMAALGEDLAQPADSDDWARVWPGPESVLYGHQVSRLPREFSPAPGVRTLGLDTGCCFGGQLSAAILEHDELAAVAQVPARRAYHRSELARSALARDAG